MGQNFNACNDGNNNANVCANNYDATILSTLCNNIGRVVIVFVDSGGCAGEGFQGLVAQVNESTCKIITTLPSPPNYNATNHCSCRCNTNEALCRRGCCSHYGSSVIVPLCSITGVVVPEI